MDAATIDRYQPGGDIYATVLKQYGQTWADNIAAAARTGDQSGEVAAAIANARTAAGITKGPQDTSTLHAFVNLISTDPLGAPLAGLNNLVGNTFFSFLKNPWVLGALAVAAFFLLGGADYLRRKIAKA